MLRLLKEHVFKQVGKASATWNFPVGTHVVLDGHTHDRIGAIFMQDHL